MGYQKRKAERLTLPLTVRLNHFHGVVRTCIVYQYALAIFVIRTFKRIITSYFLFFLLNPNVGAPVKPAESSE
jgi:hypothetical protein